MIRPIQCRVNVTDFDAAGNLTIAAVEITIDMEALVRRYVRKALRSRRGRCETLRGAILVRHLRPAPCSSPEGAAPCSSP